MDHYAHQNEDDTQDEDISHVVGGLDAQITNAHNSTKAGDTPQIHAAHHMLRSTLGPIKARIDAGAKLILRSHKAGPQYVPAAPLSGTAAPSEAPIREPSVAGAAPTAPSLTGDTL